MADALSVIPIMTIGLMIMNPIIASLRKTNPKLLILAGASLAIFGCLISTLATTFSVFLFTYALVVSFGIGFCYFPPLMCAWEWMPESKGLASGIILGGFGFGGFVFGMIGRAICNPENFRPESVAANGSIFYSEIVA